MRQYIDDFSELEGLTFSEVNSNNYDEIIFKQDNSTKYQMIHTQDCCENVSIEEIHGDLKDLVDTPILHASERTQNGAPNQWGLEMWTFYELRTIKGSVTIRWHGESNGYYSVGVDLIKLNDKK